MPFKALNNREKEKAERSYTYSHTTKHLNFTVKSKRSQSALEYMMTYGWAILIIVIVAVILYSMGIFNPSSSISATVTGFSSTPVSSATCYSNGVLHFSVGDTEGGGDHCSPELAAGSGYSEAHLCPIITVLGGWLGRRGAWSCMGAGGCMGG